jgi:hypothetical protein
MTFRDKVRWCRAPGSRHVIAHAFRLVSDDPEARLLAARSICTTVKRGDLAGEDVPQCNRCLTILEGQRAHLVRAPPRALVRRAPGSVVSGDKVRWCRASRSRHVIAHAFRLIADEPGARLLAARSLCATVERGDLAGDAVPQCERCLTILEG